METTWVVLLRGLMHEPFLTFHCKLSRNWELRLHGTYLHKTFAFSRAQSTDDTLQSNSFLSRLFCLSRLSFSLSELFLNVSREPAPERFSPHWFDKKKRKKKTNLVTSPSIYTVGSIVLCTGSQVLQVVPDLLCCTEWNLLFKSDVQVIMSLTVFWGNRVNRAGTCLL